MGPFEGARKKGRRETALALTARVPPETWEKWLLPLGGGLGAKGKCEGSGESGGAGAGHGTWRRFDPSAESREHSPVSSPEVEGGTGARPETWNRTLLLDPLLFEHLKIENQLKKKRKKELAALGPLAGCQYAPSPLCAPLPSHPTRAGRCGFRSLIQFLAYLCQFFALCSHYADSSPSSQATWRGVGAGWATSRCEGPGRPGWRQCLWGPRSERQALHPHQKAWAKRTMCWEWAE